MPGEVGGVTRPGALGPRPGILDQSVTPPSVEAGGPYSGKKDVGTLLAATVTPGSDPAPTNLWTVDSGAGTFDDDTLEDPTYTPTVGGTHILRLTVSSVDSADVFDTAIFSAGIPKNRGLLLRAGRMLH